MSTSSTSALTASERPFLLIVKVLLWVFWGVVLVIMAQIRDLEPEMADDEGAGIFLLLFGLIWIASTLTLAQYVIARGPVLHVGPDGFLDRRIFHRVIPWTEIMTGEIKGKGKVLKLTVKEPYRYRWLSGLVLTALPFLKSAFRTGRFEVVLVGLDRPREDVTAAVLGRIAAR